MNEIKKKHNLIRYNILTINFKHLTAIYENKETKPKIYHAIEQNLKNLKHNEAELK